MRPLSLAARLPRTVRPARVSALLQIRAMSAPKVNKTDAEWRAQLSPEQFRVLRQKGTEAPGSHPYDKKQDEGTYNCAACDAPLYTSKQKL